MASVAMVVMTIPNAATRAERNRRMAAPASSPASSAPIGYPASAVPRTALLRPRSALISGYRGTTLKKTAPLVRNSAATAARARRA
jgi:hypothetical protein